MPDEYGAVIMALLAVALVVVMLEAIFLLAAFHAIGRLHVRVVHIEQAAPRFADALHTELQVGATVSLNHLIEANGNSNEANERNRLVVFASIDCTLCHTLLTSLVASYRGLASNTKVNVVLEGYPSLGQFYWSELNPPQSLDVHYVDTYAMQRRFMIHHTPTIVRLDREGVVQEIHVGMLDESQIEDLLLRCTPVPTVG